MKIETVELKLDTLYRDICITENLINDDAYFRVFVLDELCGMAKIRSERSVWLEEMGEVVIKYPADWFQAFKEKYFHKKTINKFPVKYITHAITARCVYPNFVPALKNEFIVECVKDAMFDDREAENDTNS